MSTKCSHTCRARTLVCTQKKLVAPKQFSRGTVWLSVKLGLMGHLLVPLCYVEPSRCLALCKGTILLPTSTRVLNSDLSSLFSGVTIFFLNMIIKEKTAPFLQNGPKGAVSVPFFECGQTGAILGETGLYMRRLFLQFIVKEDWTFNPEKY